MSDNTGSVAGAVGAIVGLAAIAPPRACPRCGTGLPALRIPQDVREALFGGWHCPSGDVRIGRDGARLPDPT